MLTMPPTAADAGPPWPGYASRLTIDEEGRDDELGARTLHQLREDEREPEHRAAKIEPPAHIRGEDSILPS